MRPTDTGRLRQDLVWIQYALGIHGRFHGPWLGSIGCGDEAKRNLRKHVCIENVENPNLSFIGLPPGKLT